MDARKLPKTLARGRGQFLKNQLLNPLFQAALLIFGGISQLAFIHLLGSNLSKKEFESAMLILGLSLLLPFLDLGGFYSATYAFSPSPSDRPRDSIMRKWISFQYICRVTAIVGGMGLLTSLVPRLANLGIYLVLSSISLGGIWALVAIRALGKVKLSLTLLNIQWPVALAVTWNLLHFSFGINARIAFVPLIVNTAVVSVYGLFFIFSHFMQPRFESRHNEIPKLIRERREVLKRSRTYTLLSIPLPLMLFGDRYIFSYIFPNSNIGTFSIYITFFGGAVAILAVAFSVKSGHRISGTANQSEIPNIRFLGFLGAAVFPITTELVFKLLFKSLIPIPYLGILLGTYLFVLAYLFDVQTRFVEDMHLSRRKNFYWIHAITWLSLTFLLIPTLKLYASVVAGILSSTVHIILLIFWPQTAVLPGATEFQ